MAGGGVIAAAAGYRAAQDESKTTAAVVFICIIAASGGLLFGYDLGKLLSSDEFQVLNVRSMGQLCISCRGDSAFLHANVLLQVSREALLLWTISWRYVPLIRGTSHAIAISSVFMPTIHICGQHSLLRARC